MSLVKIPFMIIDSYVSDKSSTPPTPPPSPDEYVKESEKHQATFWRYENRLERLIYSALCLAECAVILANHYPTHTFSHKVFSLLHIPSAQNSMHLAFTPLAAIGLTLSILGGLLRMYCFNTLGRFFTFDFCIRRDHKLITTGPYSVVRHPSYSGFIFAYIGMVLAHLTPGALLTEYLTAFPGRFYLKEVMSVWFILRAMRCALWLPRSKQEDEGLKKTFGKEWVAWAARVKYRIIPGVI